MSEDDEGTPDRRLDLDLVIPRDDMERDFLARRIKERMDEVGLNPFSAARKAGLGPDFVRDILRGKVKSPSATRLGKLAVALDCSLNYLLGRPEPELRYTDGEPAPPTPAPSTATPESSEKTAALLPIRFELMAETLRRANDVVRPSLGFEAATVPSAYRNRKSWWELVRDNSVARVAPEGSLVQVVEMGDDERDKINDGDFVIVTKRFVGPAAAFNYVERSMRQVNYRYPDLGLWFLDYAHADPGMDATDAIWRETEPTAPRPTMQDLIREAETPEEAVALAKMAAKIEAATEDPDRKRTIGEALKRMDDPEFMEAIRQGREENEHWRHRLVGKVIRVLTPVDPLARFGIKSEK